MAASDPPHWHAQASCVSGHLMSANEPSGLATHGRVGSIRLFDRTSWSSSPEIAECPTRPARRIARLSAGLACRANPNRTRPQHALRFHG
jgi:hypothetical protein